MCERERVDLLGALERVVRERPHPDVPHLQLANVLSNYNHTDDMQERRQLEPRESDRAIERERERAIERTTG